MNGWLAAAASLLAAGCVSLPSHLAETWPADLPAKHEIPAVPFYPQDAYQCGPAALATSLTHAGVPANPDDLVGDVYLPARQGSLQIEMIAAARRRGALAYVLEPEFSTLLREVAAGNPVLVLQNLGIEAYPVWHYAVVVGYDRDKNHIVLRSGTTERLVMSLRRFAGTWRRADNWGIVVLQPPRLPATGTVAKVIETAAALENSGHGAAAEAFYGAARDRWTKSPLPYIAIANRRLAADDRESAEAALAAALAVNPDDAVARNNLADLLSTRGCHAEALREIAQAREDAAGGVFEAAVTRTAEEIASRAAAQDNVSRASCLR